MNIPLNPPFFKGDFYDYDLKIELIYRNSCRHEGQYKSSQFLTSNHLTLQKPGLEEINEMPHTPEGIPLGGVRHDGFYGSTTSFQGRMGIQPTLRWE